MSSKTAWADSELKASLECMERSPGPFPQDMEWEGPSLPYSQSPAPHDIDHMAICFLHTKPRSPGCQCCHRHTPQVWAPPDRGASGSYTDSA